MPAEHKKALSICCNAPLLKSVRRKNYYVCTHCKWRSYPQEPGFIFKYDNPPETDGPA